MDLFTERLVVKKWDSKDIALSVLFFVLALIITVVSFMFVGFLSIVIMAGAFFLAYYLATGLLLVEYEYTVTNEEFNIDKVVAKRRRVSLKTYNIKELSEGGKYDGRNAEMLCPDKNSDNLYYLEKNEGGKKECIVVDPNETMLKAFSLYMGAKFKR